MSSAKAWRYGGGAYTPGSFIGAVLGARHVACVALRRPLAQDMERNTRSAPILFVNVAIWRAERANLYGLTRNGYGNAFAAGDVKFRQVEGFRSGKFASREIPETTVEAYARSYQKLPLARGLSRRRTARSKGAGIPILQEAPTFPMPERPGSSRKSKPAANQKQRNPREGAATKPAC